MTRLGDRRIPYEWEKKPFDWYSFWPGFLLGSALTIITVVIAL